jgi:hypothetical protein
MFVENRWQCEPPHFRFESLASSKKKHSLSYLERNPFKYDSSDDEDDGGDRKSSKRKAVAATGREDSTIGEFARQLAQNVSKHQIEER